MVPFIYIFIVLNSLSVKTPSNIVETLPLQALPSWIWTQQAWTTKDDISLHLLRQDLDEKYGYGKADIPLEAVNKYKQAFFRASKQRSKLFQWGYAAYLLQTEDQFHPSDPMLLKELEATRPPLSYEFIRMRYLLDVSQFRNNDYMVALGERLAKADPNDCDVRYYLVPGIRVNTPERKRKSLLYAKDLVRISPDHADGYAVVAHVYWLIWISSHNKDVEAGRQAVHWNKEFIKHETRPSKAEAREQIQKQIDWLNKTIAETERRQAKVQ